MHHRRANNIAFSKANPGSQARRTMLIHLTHTHTASLLMQYTEEWKEPLWLVVADLETAFDTFQYHKMQKAMQHRGMPLALIYTWMVERCRNTAKLQIGSH